MRGFPRLRPKSTPKSKKISGKQAKKNAIKGFSDIYDAAQMSEDILRASQNDDLRDSIDDTISSLLSFGTNPAVLENCVDTFALPVNIMKPLSIHKNKTTFHNKVMGLCVILAEAAEAKRRNDKNTMPDHHIQNIREAFIDIAKTFPPVEELKNEYEKNFFERMKDKIRLKKINTDNRDDLMIHIMSRLDEKSK